MSEREEHLGRELVDADMLAELAGIEQEGMVSRRLNDAVADGMLSNAEQTIANIAAAKIARGELDPMTQAVLQLAENPT